MADGPSSSITTTTTGTAPPSPHARRAIVRDPRFQQLLFGSMLSLTTESNEEDKDEDEEIMYHHHYRQRHGKKWTPKACALILNGLSHLVREPADVGGNVRGLRRLVAFVADALVTDAEALAPRHVSLSLNALARLLPLLTVVEGSGGGGAKEEEEEEVVGGDWGLFVSVMISRYVRTTIREVDQK